MQLPNDDRTEINMKICNKCGASFIGDECPDCGSLDFIEAESMPTPTPEETEKKKKEKRDNTLKRLRNSATVVTIILITVLCVMLALRFIENKFFSDEISYEEAVEYVSLGMTEEEVQGLFGEPYKVDEDHGYWYYYEDKFKEKYIKYREKLDKLEDDIEKSYELYEKLEGKKTKLLRISFSGAKKTVDQIVFDNEHSFNETASTIPVNFNLGEYESVKIIDGVVAVYNEETKEFKFQKPGTYWLYDYKATFENGSFIIDSLDGERLAYVTSRPEEDTIEFDWSLELSQKSFSSSKNNVILFNDVKIPISLVLFSNDGSLSLGEGITAFKKSYVDGYADKIKTVSLPKSINTIDETLIPLLNKLTELRLSQNNDYVYKEDGVIYNNIEEVSFSDSKKQVTNELKILWIDNESLPEVLKIKEGVKKIGAEFENKTKLKELVIPKSVNSLNTYFLGCTSLRNVETDGKNEAFETENGVLYYKTRFSDLTYFRTVFVPLDYEGELILKYKTALCQLEGRSKITSIEGSLVAEGTLKGCSSLKKLSYSGLDGLTLGEIFGTEHYDGSSATVQNGVTYYIPKSLSEIELRSNNIKEGTFENCAKIKKVTISPTYNTALGTPTKEICIKRGAFAG